MGWQDRPYNRDETGGVPPVVFSFPKLTTLTIGLLAANLVLFLAQAFGGPGVTEVGRLTYADGTAFVQPWRFVTYQYLHGGAYHFFFNMIGLYFFMPTLELMWGWRKALGFYTLGGVVSGVTYGLMLLFLPAPFAQDGLIGASGSVLAAMGAVALLSPNRQLILLVFPVPIRVAVALFGALYLLSAVADRNPSDAAHLGGLAFGFFSPYLAGPALKKWGRQYDRRREQRAAAAEAEQEQTIDRILAKVAAKGMNSLTRSERNTLKQATERQRQADVRRAGRR